MTDTTQAHDLIWSWYFIEKEQDDIIKGGWDDKHDRKSTPYVRKDLHDALQAKSNEQQRQIAILTARLADMDAADDEPRAEWAGQ